MILIFHVDNKQPEILIKNNISIGMDIKEEGKRNAKQRERCALGCRRDRAGSGLHAHPNASARAAALHPAYPTPPELHVRLEHRRAFNYHIFQYETALRVCGQHSRSG